MIKNFLTILSYSIFFSFLLNITNYLWLVYLNNYKDIIKVIIVSPIILLSQYIVLKIIKQVPNFFVLNIILFISVSFGSVVIDYILDKYSNIKIIDIILLMLSFFFIILYIYSSNK